VVFRTKAIRGEAIGSHQKRKAPRGKDILEGNQDEAHQQNRRIAAVLRLVVQ
jgi:hypothetical protein